MARTRTRRRRACREHAGVLACIVASRLAREVGEGYSSPVVSQGKVFLHARRDPSEVVVAINLADGKILWQQTYSADFKKNQYAVTMAKGQTRLRS